MSGISSWTEVHNEATALAKRRKRTREPSEQSVDFLHESAVDQEEESLEFDGPYGWGKAGSPPAKTGAIGEENGGDETASRKKGLQRRNS